jgi:hypothetical protein
VEGPVHCLGHRPPRRSRQVVRAQQHAVNIPGITKIEANRYERKADGIHFTTHCLRARRSQRFRGHI